MLLQHSSLCSLVMRVQQEGSCTALEAAFQCSLGDRVTHCTDLRQ